VMLVFLKCLEAAKSRPITPFWAILLWVEDWGPDGLSGAERL
jgi:hypothetical protein